MDYETMCLNATDPEREQNVIRRRIAEKEKAQLTPYVAPFTIHPVTGMIVDANNKCVMLALSSPYGKAEATAFAEQVVALLNGSAKDA